MLVIFRERIYWRGYIVSFRGGRGKKHGGGKGAVSVCKCVGSLAKTKEDRAIWQGGQLREEKKKAALRIFGKNGTAIKRKIAFYRLPAVAISRAKVLLVSRKGVILVRSGRKEERL